MRGCMVYKERAETAAVSCGTSHVNAVSTPLRGTTTTTTNQQKFGEMTIVSNNNQELDL